MAVDKKYGQIEIPGIPADEPIFILRAQDELAAKTIADYRTSYNRLAVRTQTDIDQMDGFTHSIDDAIRTFDEWSSNNKTKLPD